MHYSCMLIMEQGKSIDECLAPFEEKYDEERDELTGFWDWYELGGRFHGYIKSKDGTNGTHYGRPLGDELKPGYYDMAKFSDCDFSYDESAHEIALSRFDKLDSLSKALSGCKTKEQFAKYQATFFTYMVVDKSGNCSFSDGINDEWVDSFYDTFLSGCEPDDVVAVVDIHN